jgi:hypothetical protein
MEEQMDKNQKIYTWSIMLLLTISLIYAMNSNKIFRVIRICEHYTVNNNLLY